MESSLPTRRLFSIPMTALLLLALAATSRPVAAQSDGAGAHAAAAKRSSIVSEVWRQLENDPHLVAKGIRLRETNGIVELDGKVPVQPWRRRAELLSSMVSGVRGVVNRIQVVHVARPDSVVVDGVRHALQATAALRGLPIAVKVGEGVVELSGYITAWEQQQLAERVARGVPGVRFCQNQLAVANAIPRTAAVMVGDVLSRLDWDPLLQHAEVEVSGHGKAIHLAGRVRSRVERRRAIRQAWVAGVQRVDASGLLVDSTDHANDGLRLSSPSDADIALAIADLAAYWPGVNYSALNVSVVSGVVTLRGNVPTFAQKRAAEELARSAVGVIEVRSELRGPWWRAPTPPRPPSRPARQRVPKRR